MKTRVLEKTVFITIYSIASIATFTLNKYIMEIMKFDMHFLLVILQCLIIVLIITTQALFSTVKINLSNHKKWYTTSLLLTAMMLSAVKAILYFPPTLFTLYKNFSIILTAIAELYFFDKQITLIAVLSFIVMMFSSFFGNVVDEISIVGYAWIICNIVSTTAYVIYLKKLMSDNLSTKIESVFFTNLISIPFISILSYSFDDYAMPKITLKLCVFIFISSVTAYLTSFSTAWSMKILSSTAYSMIGALNKLVVSASGFILFAEKFEKRKIAALIIGVLASLIYSLDRPKDLPISQVPVLETNEIIKD